MFLDILSICTHIPPLLLPSGYILASETSRFRIEVWLAVLKKIETLDGEILGCRYF